MSRRRPAPRIVLATLVALAVTSPREASSETDNRLRLDRVVAEPAYFPGYVRLRLYATAVTLQGAFIPLVGDKAFALKIGSSKKPIPYLAGAFADSSDPLGIAIIVQTDFDYTDDLAAIKTRLTSFLDKLPKDARVSIVSYTDTVNVTSLMSPSAAARKVNTLDADIAPTENVLLKAVGRAIKVLDKMKLEPPQTSARKFIVIVSDGKDVDPEPKRYRKAGERAAKKGIRIHSVAFSPHDDRRPLLGLGELSKRSFGTFRWVRDHGLFGGQFDALAAEVGRQYILTFFIKPENIEKKKVSLIAADTSSNALKVRVSCGEESCSGTQYCFESRCVTRRRPGETSILRWVIYIIGGLVGALVLLALIGFLLSRRKSVPMPPPGMQMPGAPGAPPAPAEAAPSASSHRIMAVDSQGRAVGGGAAPGATAHVGARASAMHAAPAQPQQQAGQPMLYIAAGPNPGHTIPVVHGMTIGTHPGCQLALVGDGFASSVHAQILMDTSGNYSIVDKGSTNGTFINGVRAQRSALTHGTTIKIGSAELRFLVQ